MSTPEAYVHTPQPATPEYVIDECGEIEFVKAYDECTWAERRQMERKLQVHMIARSRQELRMYRQEKFLEFDESEPLDKLPMETANVRVHLRSKLFELNRLHAVSMGATSWQYIEYIRHRFPRRKTDNVKIPSNVITARRIRKGFVSKKPAGASDLTDDTAPLVDPHDKIPLSELLDNLPLVKVS